MSRRSIGRPSKRGPGGGGAVGDALHLFEVLLVVAAQEEGVGQQSGRSRQPSAGALGLRYGGEAARRRRRSPGPAAGRAGSRARRARPRCAGRSSRPAGSGRPGRSAGRWPGRAGTAPCPRSRRGPRGRASTCRSTRTIRRPGCASVSTWRVRAPRVTAGRHAMIVISRRPRQKVGLTVLQQHLDHFREVAVQLVEGLTLGMSSGEARDVADEQSRFRARLDHSGERSHPGTYRLLSEFHVMSKLCMVLREFLSCHASRALHSRSHLASTRFTLGARTECWVESPDYN